MLCDGVAVIRGPLRPELAAPLGVWPSSQLARCAGGRQGLLLYFCAVPLLAAATGCQRFSSTGSDECSPTDHLHPPTADASGT